MVGRRGQSARLYEWLLGLIFVAAFAAVVVNYILANANGETYFSKFYAADLATSAEIVNAGAGDVVLRYDNLKPTLDLRFWLDNGKVGVSMIPATSDFPAAVNTLVDAVPKFFSQLPADAAARFYGKQQVYQSGPAVVDRPTFLILRKVGATFSISETETELRDCPRVSSKAVAKENALIYLNVTSPVRDDEDTMRTLLASALKETDIKMTEDREKANIIIELTKSNGDHNEISAAPTSADGQSLVCLFSKRLEAITLSQYGTPQVRSAGAGFTVQITITAKDKLTNEQIVQALVNALAVYYK